MYQIVSWLVSWLINTGSNQGFKHFKEGHFWHAREQGAYSKVEQSGTIWWFFFNSMDLVRGPPSGVRASGNWLFFVREFVKTKKIVREFVKTMLFVNREKTKYRS